MVTNDTSSDEEEWVLCVVDDRVDDRRGVDDDGRVLMVLADVGGTD